MALLNAVDTGSRDMKNIVCLMHFLELLSTTNAGAKDVLFADILSAITGNITFDLFLLLKVVKSHYSLVGLIFGVFEHPQHSPQDIGLGSRIEVIIEEFFQTRHLFLFESIVNVLQLLGDPVDDRLSAEFSPCHDLQAAYVILGRGFFVLDIEVSDERCVGVIAEN